MATVTLDSSEYDMLRETNKQREQELKDIKREKGEEIEKLKEEIKGLENGSRVIIKSTVYESAYIPKLKSMILGSLKKYYGEYEEQGLYSPYNLVASSRPSFESIISSAAIESLNTGSEDVFGLSTNPRGPYNERSKEIVRYVGFDDIKMVIEKKIEDDVSNEYQEKLKKLEKAEKQYEEKTEQLEETMGEEHKKDINRVTQKYEKIISQLKEDLNAEKSKKKALEKDIKDMKIAEDDMKAAYENKLRQAHKTNEERIQEAQEELEAAQAKLNQLGVAKKSFLSKLFKK